MQGGSGGGTANQTNSGPKSSAMEKPSRGVPLNKEQHKAVVNPQPGSSVLEREEEGCSLEEAMEMDL